MGLLDALLGLLGLRRPAKLRPEASPLGLFATLFRENYAFLAGGAAPLEARDSVFEVWDASFSGEKRISVLEAHDLAVRPAAWLFLGGGTAMGLREAHHRARGGSFPLEGDAAIKAELDAVELLTEGLAAALASEGAEGSLSYDIVDPGAMQLFRWTLRDARFLEYRSSSGGFFLAIDAEAHERLLSRLALPFFIEDVLGRVRAGAREDAEDLAEPPKKPRNEALKIEGARDFPLATILAPKRMPLGFGEARLRPEALLICGDPSLIAERASEGYCVQFRFSSAAKSKDARLYFLASPLGAFEAGSEEWRSLLKNASARCAAALARLLRLEVAVAAAAPALAETSLTSFPLSAISYNASIGGAIGTLVLAFGADLLSIIASRLFGPDEVERLRLCARNIFLAIESINARVASAGFASYRRSLSALPPVAVGIASRLPVGGRPLYSILEELGEKDIGAILGKLAQKGVIRREGRYSFFLHGAPLSAEGTGSLMTAATPCDDYEALFSRFPKRWEEADGARPRLFPAFVNLDTLLESHYEATWLLYRELLADRLSLSSMGEAVLRASGESFASRLGEALEEQGGELRRIVESMGEEERNSQPWADRARLLHGLPDLAEFLSPSIGERAAGALRDSIMAAGARLRDGREDAYELWKARLDFIVDLTKPSKD